MIDVKKLFPQAGVRTQLFFAAVIWLIGAGMILRLAMIYLVQVGTEHWWIPPIGLTLGLVKAYFLMIPSAAKTIERVRGHGRNWIFNSYAPRVYLMVGGMIAAGIALRLLGPTDILAYQMFLAVLYLIIGIGMLLSVGVFLAALRKSRRKL
ncbi:MAG: hypothetical protein FWC86_01390 [Coriobacteriia bacterium]|nr:hypothetical protein [Coriobacteriia bacterium]